ncbi:hypothetical protein [Dysgonomonas sp. GY617]|uniref:hypothetical protein n=1 Tax=Dysgonomonas sp. GY617 TaxID=2780420 RepID=UPI00188385F8|nr:hypothetical protein [Dysgonomonas sp. GY617]MBF0577150.1 hypothetical protein [Dysgonomonas sp. GY617]
MVINRICILLLFVFLSISLLDAQVGINTEDPKVTLDVVSTRLDASTAEGMIAPRLTLGQLVLKDAMYMSDQTGSIVYVTNILGSTTAKTQKVTMIGYYYFDGVIWQPLNSNPASRFFYMPSVPFDTSVDATGQIKDLYNLYYAQFTGTSGHFAKSTSAPGQLPYVPVATDLYYYITDYDNSVFSNITIDDTGIMTYDVTASATDATFINIIFVLK